MTTFTELPVIARGFISLWFVLLLLISCSAVFRLFSRRIFAPAILACAVTLASYILLQWCSDVAICYDKKLVPPHSSVLIDGLSFMWLLLIAFLLTLADICFILYLYRWKKTHLTVASLKEGIDDLPSGLCWYYGDGAVALRNRAMERLCAVITNRELYDGNLLKEALLCRMDDHRILILPDGTAWNIVFSTIEKDGVPLNEICAYNVTEEYKTTLLLKEKKEQAWQANEKLTKYSHELARMITAGEILAAKVRIHDELGQGLLLTRKYLLRGGTEEDKKKLLYVLQKNSTLMESRKRESGRSYLDMILEAASDMGVTLVIDGRMPEADSVGDIITNAIHENLTNTIRHAQGNEMRVELREENGVCRAVFTNNGAVPTGPIEERGGLAMLRTLTESAGGEMYIEYAPQFRMTLRFATGETEEGRKQ